MPASDFEPPNANIHGEICGVPVGTGFRDRDQLYEAGVHGRSKWGIHGTEDEGAFAIVLNGGYEDDMDQGDVVYYTGHGKGNSNDKKEKMLGKGSHQVQGRQVGDQKWTLGNKALRRSWKTKYPVRVIRGQNGNFVFSPKEGYRYDGEYQVVKAYEDKGKEGFMICRFKLVRCPDQAPLLNRATPILNWWKPPVPRNLRRYLEEPEAPAPPKPKKQLWTKEKLDVITDNRKLDKLGRIPKYKKG